MSTRVCSGQLPNTLEKVPNMPWWNRRIKFETTVCFTTLIVLLILGVMTASLAFTSIYFYQNFFGSSSHDICLSAGCVKAASSVLEMIDEKIDPCQNFYRFACGGYLEKHEIPDDRSYKAVFLDIDDELNLKLKVSLRKQLNGSEPTFVKMIKDMYDSCMNLNDIEEANGEPLKNLLKSLGGWPVVEGDSWDGSKFDWLETLLSFRRLGYSHDMLLSLSVMQDIQNNINYVIALDQASLGMPDRTYLMTGLNDSSTAAYFRLMVKAANKLGANEANSEKELMEAFNFERTLANYSLPREERSNISSLYNKYTVKKFQELVPQVDWLMYFNGLLNDPVSENETIIVYDPKFVKKFGELITTVDKRTIANYMMWRVVQSSLSFLSKEWRYLDQEYESVISGTNQEPPRWQQCMSLLSSKLSIALSSHYVKNFFREKSKAVKALELVKYIHHEFLNILDNIDWMEKSTKLKAKEKANAIISFIGYPPELLIDGLVLKVYGNLTFTKNNYFKNRMILNKWDTDDSFNQLRKSVIKGDWKDHASVAVVNAFYDSLDNSIDFPAGLLQNPYFDEDRPYYMNFGSMGSTIGHEITHGFDDQGRQFDKDGNNKNWWDETTDEKFKEKAKCMIYQYGNYTTENGIQLNGVNTLGENIADNGGLKEAYMAYQTWVQDHGTEKELPGLKYTPIQLFWISAANVECIIYRPEELKLTIISGSHSPAQFRVNGPVSNLPEFSKDFQCPHGSPMNPYKKCQVW